jgi:hypothetical protein
MSMPAVQARRGPDGAHRPTVLLRLLAGASLGAATALLVSCSGSGKGLIPSAQAGPLKNDFALVEEAARAGHGSCAATEAALQKTESDFAALPATVDPGLRQRLRDGITKLHEDALELCAQALTQSTTASTTPRTTTTTQSTATTQTTPPTTTTPSTPNTTTAPPNPSGGTPAKESEAESEAESGGVRQKGKGKDKAGEPPAGGAAPPGEGGK